LRSQPGRFPRFRAIRLRRSQFTDLSICLCTEDRQSARARLLTLVVRSGPHSYVHFRTLRPPSSFTEDSLIDLASAGLFFAWELGGNPMAPPLLFLCPKTNQPAPTGIETDVQSLGAAWKTTVKMTCPYCGAEISVVQEISVRETYLAGALFDATDRLRQVR
jgi:hypothetical protein